MKMFNYLERIRAEKVDRGRMSKAWQLNNVDLKVIGKRTQGDS